MSSQSPKQTEGIVWTISRRLGMVVVLALAFVLSAGITIYTLFRTGETRVPDLTGRTEIEAQRMAESVGLRVKIQRRPDPRAAADTVIETRPPANSLIKKDSSVIVVVSSGATSGSAAISEERRGKTGDASGTERPK
jgi:hypothetical protein